MFHSSVGRPIWSVSLLVMLMMSNRWRISDAKDAVKISSTACNDGSLNTTKQHLYSRGRPLYVELRPLHSVFALSFALWL